MQYRVPALLAVGLEGFWGVIICVIALPILSVVRTSNGQPIDSFSGAFTVGYTCSLDVLMLYTISILMSAADTTDLPSPYEKFDSLVRLWSY